MAKAEIEKAPKEKAPNKSVSETSCRHTDKLCSGNEIIPTVDESHAHDKTSNVKGIHEGKRPKGIAHPKE